MPYMKKLNRVIKVDDNDISMYIAKGYSIYNGRIVGAPHVEKNDNIQKQQPDSQNEKPRRGRKLQGST